MRSNDQFFPGLTVRHLTEQIIWRYYKHWGQGYLAGEGVYSLHGDRSGCLDEDGRCDPPNVAQARLYESPKGSISAVYSYPNGIAPNPGYFWEIWNSGIGPQILQDIERFDTEQEMEQRIVEVLSEHN